MTQQVTYLFGARTQNDLYCLAELDNIKAASNGRFEFIPVLSQEPEDSDWSGLRGRAVDEILKAHDLSIATNAYLCGPPGMIDSAIEILNQNGLSEANIFYDKFLDASTMQGGRM